LKLRDLNNIFLEKQEIAKSFIADEEFSLIYETHGGVGLNAYTSYDQTAYHLQLPSNKAELWCYMESERIRRPVLRGYYEERDVVTEERFSRTDDNPSSLLIEEFMAATFKAHPYRNPIIGHYSDIRRLTPKDIHNFRKTFYQPSKMTLVIVGDVKADEIFAMVEKYFGSIPANPSAPSVRTIEPNPQPRRG
jgi:predicted Zn-dependent peptidase